MTSLFHQTFTGTIKCILSGSCPKCHYVLEHDCPHAQIAIKSHVRGGISNITVGPTTYQCPVCLDPIPHNHRCA